METALTSKIQQLSEKVCKGAIAWIRQRYYAHCECKLSKVEHEDYSGYMALNDGGHELWVRLDYNEVIKSCNCPQSFRRNYNASLGDAREAWECEPEENREELEDFTDEWMETLFGWIKVIIFLKGIQVYVQVYYCFDEHGRDSISWLKEMGGNPSQTIGRYERIVNLDDFDPKEVFQGIIAELIRLETEV